MKTHELMKILKRYGCYYIRAGTRHDIWYSPITQHEFPVWRHKGEMPKGTVNEILKEAGINL